VDNRKWLIAMAIGSVMACGGGSSPTAPTAPTTPANIAGSYNVAIGAASSCSANLPVETRVLNYVANVSQTGAAFNVQLLAHVIWNTATVTGTVSGQTLTFSTFSFSEITTGGGVALSTTGTANVAADGSISGTLNGTYQTPSGSNCNAANHQLHMVKR
jgi:hypothetical protein